MEKYSPKFYDFNIYGKTHARQESARATSSRDYPERRVWLFRFCDHRLVRIVRDLIVKKYFGASLTLLMIYLLMIIFIIILAAMSEGYRLSVFLGSLLMHRFLSRSDIYEKILDFSF